MLADSFGSPWLALYVETPSAPGSEEQSHVTKALALARELGADVITTSSDDVVAAITRVAVQRNITQIAVGRSAQDGLRRHFRGDAFVSRLLREAAGVAIQVVPVETRSSLLRGKRLPNIAGSILAQYLRALTVIAIVTLGAFLFTPLIGAHATALVFLLTVVLLALFVDRGPTLAAAASLN